MLLSISTTYQPASDLGFLLHKHPDRFQTFELSFGQAHVFYTENSTERTTAALLLEIDAVGMVRDRRSKRFGLLTEYVNDRPYVASSLISVALNQVFRSAMSGICKDRPQLSNTAIPLTVQIDVLPVRGGEEWLRKVFEPLGYAVTAVRHPLDPQFPEWGESPYYSVTITASTTLSAILTHLYVLIPVFDGSKHYYVGDDELEKLLEKGDGWLAQHPERDQIARRYLTYRPSLFREALARLTTDVEIDETSDDTSVPSDEEPPEERVSLNTQRLGAVVAALKNSGASSVVDLGCGDGKLLRELLSDRQFQRIVGMDVSIRSLEIAQRRLKLDSSFGPRSDRIQLLHGSLLYRDDRLSNFDAAAIVEVIEHFDPPRLSAFERAIFEFAKPKTVVVTTPNQEYNSKWETLPAGQFRHTDHRFEWTRTEFQQWAERVAQLYGYAVRFVGIGPIDEQVGSPTQMCVFEKQPE